MYLKGRTIFMTGATSGLGRVSALKAAQCGATVLVLLRNQVKGRALIEELENQPESSNGKIKIIEGDLTSFDSIKSACSAVLLQYPVIDILVNNAGIMNFEHRNTADDIEETLQVNLQAPVLICHLLFPALLKSDDPKIIFTASGLHQGEINFSNLEFRNSFSSFKSYRQSKLGVILICRLLAKPLQKHNIGIYSQHPGMVRTALGKNGGWLSRAIFYLMGKSAKRGSQTLSFLIDTKGSQLTSGEYYANKKITRTTKESYNMAMGHKLMETILTYLEKHVSTDSPILQVN